MAHKFWERMSGAQLVFMVNFVVAWGVFFEGWNQGNMGFVNSAPTYQLKMGLGPGDGTVTNPTREGGIVAIYYLGGTIGGLWGGHIADKYGRVKALILGALFVLLGGSLMATAENIAWMCCSRVIAGLGVGFFIGIIPVWSSEITSARRRGSHFSLLWCGNFLGIFCAYWVGYALSFVDGGNSTIRWRLPLALQVVLPAIMIPAIWVLPESPRWLIKEGRNEEALRIIAVLRGDGNADHPDVKREYIDILKTFEEDKRLADFDSYWRLATDYKEGGLHYGRRVLLAFGIQILVEVGTGIALTTIYAPTVFKQAGFSTAKIGWLSGLNGAMGLAGTAVAAFFCDRFGRRMNLMLGNTLLGTWMWIYAGLSKGALDHPDQQSSYGSAASAMILIFTFTLCVFWMIPCFIYAAEIFPTALRAKGNGFLVAGWGLGIGSGVLWFPIVVQKLGYKTFYIFGAANYVWIAVIYCFFPETAGRSLESIDLLFRSDSWFAWRNEKDYERLAKEHEEGVARGVELFEKAGIVGHSVEQKERGQV